MDLLDCEEAVRRLLSGNSVSPAAPIMREVRNTPLGAGLAVVCTPGVDPADARTVRARAYFAADALSDPKPQPPEIILVASQLADERELEQALVHELVHAKDHVSGLDLTVCDELACSEIKANGLVECGMAQQRLSRIGLVCGLGPESRWCREFRNACTQDHATTATRNVFPSNASACVERAMARCSPYAAAAAAAAAQKN